MSQFYNKQSRKDIRLDFFETNVQNIISRVHARKAELGFVYISKRSMSAFKQQIKSKGLEYHELTKVPLYLFVGRNNPLYKKDSVEETDLKDIKLSIIILLSHYISNFIIGIILRNNNNLKDNIVLYKTNSFLNIYYSAIRNTVISVSIIFANILFFSFVLSIVKYFISINPIFDSILYGSLEFSSGIYNITHLISNKFINGLIITIIITFSSFSIHMQIINLNKKIRYFKYLIYRFINVFISIIIFIILFNLLQ